MKEVGTLKHIKILKFLSMFALILTVLFAGGCADSSQNYNSSSDYMLNIGTKTIHESSCSSVKYTKSEYLKEASSYYFATLRGYRPCKSCTPQANLSLLSASVYVVLLILSLAPIFIITYYSRSRSKTGCEPPKMTTLIIIMLISEFLTVTSHESLYYAIFDTNTEMPLYLTILFGTCFIIKFAHDEFRIVDGVVVSFSRFKSAMKKEYRQILKEPGIVKMPRYQLNQTIKELWGEYPLLKQNVTSSTTTDNTRHSTEDNSLFCRKCGAKLLNDSTFCHKCGTEVVTTDE